MTRQVSRKVHFFRIHAGLDEDGGQLVDVDPRRILSEIEALPFDRERETDTRYVRLDEDDFMACWVPESTRYPLRASLAKIRMGNLPETEHGGQLDPLEVPDDTGIAEQTYLRFFQGGVVGALFNFYGPRASTLAWYMKKTVPLVPARLSLDHLLRPDLLARVDELEEVRVLDLRVKRSEIEAFRAIDGDIFEVLEGLKEFNDAEQFEIVLRPRSYARHGIGEKAMRLIRRVVGLDGEPQIDALDRLKIEGYKGGTHEKVKLDLLAEHFVEEEEVTLEDDRTRALNRNSAYRAIARAYGRAGGDLNRATVVGVPHGPGP